MATSSVALTTLDLLTREPLYLKNAVGTGSVGTSDVENLNSEFLNEIISVGDWRGHRRGPDPL